MRPAILAGIMSLSLTGCEKPLPPDAQRIYDEELAKVRGELVLSRSDFEQLSMGSSYADAVSILRDEGVEVSRTQAGGAEFTTFRWAERDGSNIILMYENDRLVSKSQAGLD